MAGKCWLATTVLAVVAQGIVTSASGQEPEAQTPGVAETPTQANATAQQDEEAIELDTISVTATRNPIRAFEYPGMVTVVDREEIQLRQASTPDDVLRAVPNVEFTGGPRRTGEVPSIRGFEGADVVILLDGARQNFGSGHDGRFFVDPSLLKRVEVVRGSASSLYGSGGNGGVIEFTTVDANDYLQQGQSFGASSTAGFQSVNDERLATVSAFAKPVAGLDMVASVTKRDSGVIDLGDRNELSFADDNLLSGLAKVSYTFGGAHRVEGSFLGFENEAREPNDGQGAGDRGLVDKELVSNTWRAAYNYSDPNNNLVDLDVTTYFSQISADEKRLDDEGVGPEGEDLKRDVETIGFRLDNRSRMDLPQDIFATFTYGAEAYRDVQDGAADDDERDGVPDADADFLGIFGQLELNFAEPFGVIPGELIVLPGLRYDFYQGGSDIADSIEEDQISPRIGVSYLPTDWLMVFGNYGHAFRAPTFDELYADGLHFQAGPFSNFFIPNADLKPQKTESIEFGGGLDFRNTLEVGDLFQVKASHFLIWGDDFLDSQVDQPDAGNGTAQTVNIPEAELWGTEVEARYDSQRTAFVFGYATINGENTDTDEKLGVLSPDQFTVDAALKLPEFDSVIGWRAIVARDFSRTNDESEERDGYVVNDVYFAWQASQGLLRGTRVDLGIDNVFDETYARTFTDSKEQGRNFKVQLSYSMAW